MELNFKKIGQGQPLLILHGLFGSADNWLGIANDLKKNYTLYLVDQRNHGDSPHHEEWDFKVMSDDILDFVEKQNLEKTHIMGHSMGGKAAMNFALNHPGRVEKLIVVDIAPRYYPVHHQTILDGLNAIDLNQLKSRNAADEILAKYEKDKGVRQFLLKSLGRNDQGNYFWKINLPVITEKIENVSRAIDHQGSFDKPTLFMGGANSQYIQDSDKEEIEKYFPNSQIIKMKNAGHWIHAEQPEAVVKTVRMFLG